MSEATSGGLAANFPAWASACDFGPPSPTGALVSANGSRSMASFAFSHGYRGLPHFAIPIALATCGAVLAYGAGVWPGGTASER